MKSGVLMMCCSRLSSLPHGDDVPWYCLDMSASCYTVPSVWPAHSHWSRLQNSRSEKNQNIQQSYRPVPHAESVWAAVENNSTYKKKTTEVFLFFFAFVPPVDRNLRSRQECARAWSWLSSKQISMRRQVCSACPHSCSCLQLFSFPSGDRIRRVTCSKTGMLAHERTV